MDWRHSPRVLVACGLAALMGCTLPEAPEGPVWRVALDRFPVFRADTVALGEDLVEDNIQPVGPRNQLAGVFTTDETYDISDQLNLNAVFKTFQNTIGPFDVAVIAPQVASITFADAFPALAGANGQSQVVPASTLPALGRSVTFSEFQSLALTTGILRIRITNGMNVALGSPLQVDVTGVGTATFSTLIIPGGSAEQTLSLASRTIGSNLPFTVTGQSAGSQGATVVINTSSTFQVRLSVEAVKAGQATAQVPAQSFEVADSVVLSTASIGVDATTIQTGNMQLTIQSSFPMPVDLNVRLLELELSPGTPYTQVVQIPADGSQQLVIPLVGARVVLNGGALDIAATATLTGSTAYVAVNSNDNIQVSAQVSPLTLASVTGLLTVTESLPVVDQPFLEEQIEGLDTLALGDATLTLTFDRPPFDMLVTGALEGVKRGQVGTRVPLQFAVPRGVVTTVTLDRRGTDGDGSRPTVVDLFGGLPERVRLTGAAVASGAGVTVTRTDQVTVTVGATVPLECQIPTKEVTAIQEVDLSKDARETIRDNVIGVRLQGTIENYTPFSASVAVFLGQTPQSITVPFLQGIGITAGTADGSGFIASPGVSNLDIQLQKPQLDDLLTYRYYKTVITLSAGPGSRLTSQDRIIFKEIFLTGEVEIDVNNLRDRIQD